MDIMKFFEQQRLRERKIKITRFKQLNVHARKGQILFAGSSLAEQFPIDELRLLLDPVPIIYNRGIGGDIMADLEGDCDTLIFDLAPRLLFINIGSNDLNSPQYKEDDLLGRYEKLLRRIIERLPKTSIFVLSYYPVNPTAPSDIPPEHTAVMFANRNNSNINHINQRLENLARALNEESKSGVEYIDVNTCLQDEHGQLAVDLTVEGIHLWPEAYKRVLEVLAPYLSAARA